MEDDIQVSDWPRRRAGAAVHAGEPAEGAPAPSWIPCGRLVMLRSEAAGAQTTPFCHLLARDPAVTHGAPSPPLTRGINDQS